VVLSFSAPPAGNFGGNIVINGATDGTPSYSGSGAVTGVSGR